MHAPHIAGQTLVCCRVGKATQRELPAHAHDFAVLGSCRRQAQLQRSARTPVAFSETSDSDPTL